MKMRFLIFVLLLVMSSVVFSGEKNVMDSYYENILERRTSEASKLWEIMINEGFNEKTVAALDFTFFSNDKNSAQELSQELAVDYTTEIIQSNESGYWLIKGTTRPYGNEFSKRQWMSWVDYMVSKGAVNNSTFSTWAVYEPKSKNTWSSESIEVD